MSIATAKPEITYAGQVVAEAPEIQAYKIALLDAANQQIAKPITLPAYQSAGLSDLQKTAAGVTGQYAQQGQGVGGYAPFMQAGANLLGSSADAYRGTAQALGSLNVSPYFQTGQQGMLAAAQTTAGISPYVDLMGAGYQNIGQGSQTLGGAKEAAMKAGTTAQGISPFAQVAATGYGNIGQGTQTLGQAASGLQGASSTAGGISPYAGIAGLGYENIGQGTQAIGLGTAMAGGATQGFDPTQTQGFMNPYQQQVIDEAIRQIDRQGEIAQQGLSAQAVRSGAFGGTREGVQRAELGRNLSEMKNQAIVGGLQSGYQSAQQQAQAAFEAQQARQAQAAQTLGNMGQALTQQGLATGQLAGQQAGLVGQEAALQAQINQALAGVGQAQTQQGLATGQLAGQQAGLYGQQSALESQLAGQLANIGQAQTQQGLAGAQIAGQQANTVGNVAQLQSQIGQGIGGLASQQAQNELSRIQGMGQLAQGLGSLAQTQAGFGTQAQGLAQGDINTYLALGGLQSQAAQQEIDANRATQLQQTMMPYQQLGFLSDIYKGAPSTSSTLTGMSAPGTSPLAQAIGMGTAIYGAGKAAGGN
jgi:hypothetical protein